MKNSFLTRGDKKFIFKQINVRGRRTEPSYQTGRFRKIRIFSIGLVMIRKKTFYTRGKIKKIPQHSDFTVT